METDHLLFVENLVRLALYVVCLIFYLRNCTSKALIRLLILAVNIAAKGDNVTVIYPLI